jgi:hypothetical protein
MLTNPRLPEMAGAGLPPGVEEVLAARLETWRAWEAIATATQGSLDQ